MSDNRRSLDAAGWRLQELADLRKTPPKRSIADVIADIPRDQIRDVHQEMRLLAAAGIPADRAEPPPRLQAWVDKCRYQHTKTTIWVLKCKPSPVRIYFIADPSNRRAIALLSVIKKRDERNTNDFQTCCALLQKLKDPKGTLRVVDIDWIT